MKARRGTRAELHQLLAIARSQSKLLHIESGRQCNAFAPSFGRNVQFLRAHQVSNAAALVRVIQALPPAIVILGKPLRFFKHHGGIRP